MASRAAARGRHAGGVDGEQPLRYLPDRVHGAMSGDRGQCAEQAVGPGGSRLAVQAVEEALAHPGVAPAEERPVGRRPQTPQVLGDRGVVAPPHRVPDAAPAATTGSRPREYAGQRVAASPRRRSRVRTARPPGANRQGCTGPPRWSVGAAFGWVLARSARREAGTCSAPGVATWWRDRTGGGIRTVLGRRLADPVSPGCGARDDQFHRP